MLSKSNRRAGAAVALSIVLAISSPALQSQTDRPGEGYIPTRDGLRLYYRIDGDDGGPVIAVHGGPGYSMAYLRPDLSPLAERHSVIYYDQRGSGRSTVTADASSMSVDLHVEDLEAVREFFGLERIVLLGHSWGAGLAANYAVRFPDRVGALLLVAPIPPVSTPYMAEFSSNLTASMDDAALERLAELTAARMDAEDPIAACRAQISLLIRGYFADPERTSAMRGDVCSDPPEAVSNQDRARALTMASLGDWDWRPDLRTVDARTLVIHGAEDPIPLESAGQWAAYIPDARLLEVDDSGHFPFVEQAESFFAAAGEFLDGRWPTGSRRIAPLFSSDAELEISLHAPIRTIVNRMSRRPSVDGMLRYTGARGEPVELYAEITSRGVSRLEICRFPPLRLNFRRSEVIGTLFAEQDRIKLGTRCMPSSRYEQYMLLEYLIYRIYEQVTELGFKVRLAKMSYVDTDRNDRTESAPAYFIEHIDGLAGRVGMNATEQEDPIAVDDLDGRQLALFSVFQYMIGNTDWSTIRSSEGRECCHNTDILGPRDATGPLIPVPYDFDQAGLIDTPYALPAEGLRLRSVTDRRYRGMCSSNDHVEDAIERFNSARDRIEALFEMERLEEEYRRQALDYLDRSYQIINDPDLRQSEIFARCRRP